MRAFLSQLDVTHSVGPDHDLQAEKLFDDLSAYGGFPVQQRIERITRLEVIVRDGIVNGLRVTYQVAGSPVVVEHGKVKGTKKVVDLSKSSTHLVGAFGKCIEPGNPGRSGRISTIGFLVFDSEHLDTPIRIEGPHGNDDENPINFGTFGRIIAFNGSTDEEYGLRSLGFVKSASTTPSIV